MSTNHILVLFYLTVQIQLHCLSCDIKGGVPLQGDIFVLDVHSCTNWLKPRFASNKQTIIWRLIDRLI
jgi:hypothetical protein